MPTYDLYRETTTREHYRIEADTPEAAFALYEDGNLSLSNDEVIDAQPPTVALDGVLVLDTATIPAEPDEPETQTFTCKVGVDARAYFDIEIDAVNADEALSKLKSMAAIGFSDLGLAGIEYEMQEHNAVLISIQDEAEEYFDKLELVPLDYEPFDAPPAVQGISHSTSIFDQFALLRSLVGTTDPAGRDDMREIIAHLEAKLSPATYSRRIHRAAELKAAIDEAGKKAVDRHASRLIPSVLAP